MLRNFLLWWRAKGCYHKCSPSKEVKFLHLPQCERCGTVFHADGHKFVRQLETRLGALPVSNFTKPI